MIVLDASVTLASVFPDEKTPAVQVIMDLLSDKAAWVPSFWHIEVANGLEIAVRRKRIAPAYRDQMIVDLKRTIIQVDHQISNYAWTDVKRLAERYQLTLYDAAYLELALRLDMPLATLDRALRAAAEAEHVLLLGL